MQLEEYKCRDFSALFSLAQVKPREGKDIIIYCAFENRVSQKAPSICRILTAYAERVNVRDFYNREQYKVSRKERKPAASPQSGRARGFSLISSDFFHLF